MQLFEFSNPLLRLGISHSGKARLGRYGDANEQIAASSSRLIAPIRHRGSRDDLARSPGKLRHIHRRGLATLTDDTPNLISLIHNTPKLISAVFVEESPFDVRFVLAHERAAHLASCVVCLTKVSPVSFPAK
jgi:hypothetical protein